MHATLLIAENDHPLAELYRQHFVASGYRVLTASDGAECLDLIRRESPTVLVAALELPWDNGHKTIDCLRAESRQRPIPSVILTGFVPHHQTAQWNDPFLVSYLLKPVSAAAILDYVRLAQTRPTGWRIFRAGECLE